MPSERVQIRNLEFCLDRIFDDDSQDAIYRACCEPSVSSVVDGLNATILAFGQTGAGKTYSMFGSEDVLADFQALN